MEKADSLSALDRATPRTYWIWAGLIALVGLVLRYAWYSEFYGSGIYWLNDLGRANWAFYEQAIGQPDSGMFSSGELLTPIAGDLLRLTMETTSRAQLIETWSMLQNALLAVTTLATFALSRRVLFGWTSLLPAALLTFNPLLAELAFWPSEYVLLMSFVVVAVLLLCIAHELSATGSADWRIATAVVPAGLLLGLAVLTHLAAWLFFVPVLWWAFRGVDRSWAVVLVLAALLLPAIQLGVMTGSDAQKRDDARVLIERGLGSESGAVPADAAAVAERAGAVADPSPQPLLRPSLKDFRTAGWVVLSVLIALALVGVWALWQEGAGSSSRLLVLPLLMLIGIFFDSTPWELRNAVFPSLLICSALGLILVADRISLDRNSRET